MPVLTISGHPVEVEEIAGTKPGAPPLVFLHEGLGSVAMWRDFPALLAQATGARTIVYSRLGYGRSGPTPDSPGSSYMGREALELLPALRAALGLDEPSLVGHSDGGTIALLHAAAARWPVRALLLEAPHVFVEDISIAGITAAKEAYENGDLKPRLARFHDDVEGVFRFWNDSWLAPSFRSWNIEAALPAITCPTLLIQGSSDAYGTLAQLDAIERGVAGPCERVILDCGHSPHRERASETLAAMAAFISRL